MKRIFTFLVWMFLLIFFIIVYTVFSGKDEIVRDYSKFVQDVDAGNVYGISYTDHGALVYPKNSGGSYLIDPSDADDFGALIEQHGIPVLVNNSDNYRQKEEGGWMDTLLVTLIPIVVVLLVLYFLFKQKMKNAGFDLTKLRTSPARLANSEERKVLFSDVAGCVEAKELLGDIVGYLKDPACWKRTGARVPRGVLLEGPSGCGKTLLAQAVAGETKANFYTVSASEFVELFVGVGAARMRDTFEMAAKNAPAIVFIDEIDALGRRRGSGVGGGHDEREQTLNQLLLSMDGFQKRDSVIIIAATNRADILDKALLRPGRFDRRITVPVLNRDGRLQAFEIHSRNKPVSEEVSLEELTDKTDGFTGAEIENIMNEAALLAARRLVHNRDAKPEIVKDDFTAVLKVSKERNKRFSAVDAVLVEAATQFSEPPGNAHVKLHLKDSSIIQGKIVWVDSVFFKLSLDNDQQDITISKREIAKVETLEDSSRVSTEDVGLDVWARSHPDSA